MNTLSSSQRSPAAAPLTTGPRARWRLRLGIAIAIAVAAGAAVFQRSDELGAAAIVRAPNFGRPAASVALPGEMLLQVGPPTATLSVEIVDTANPRGTVFLLHGIRNSKQSMRGWAQLFARRGYRTVLVDSRGQGRSSGDALTYGVQESRDLSNVVDALDRAGKIAGPIGVFGHSYGAATALEWAGRDPRVRAVVAVAPFASLREVVPRYTPLRLPASVVNHAIDRAGREGGFDPDLASPLEANRTAHAAVLIVHGSDDAKIPVAQSHEVAAAGADHTTLVVVDGAGHDDVMGSPGADLANRAPDWFDAHLGGRISRTAAFQP
jgi:pimeloyl-ACP methyl ester carboxylesterase